MTKQTNENYRKTYLIMRIAQHSITIIIQDENCLHQELFNVVILYYGLAWYVELALPIISQIQDIGLTVCKNSHFEHS